MYMQACIKCQSFVIVPLISVKQSRATARHLVECQVPLLGSSYLCILERYTRNNKLAVKVYFRIFLQVRRRVPLTLTYTNIDIRKVPSIPCENVALSRLLYC